MPSPVLYFRSVVLHYQEDNSNVSGKHVRALTTNGAKSLFKRALSRAIA